MEDSRIEAMDKEWVALILEAKKQGLTKAEIQNFISISTKKAFEPVTK